jgi:hypothetical protein
MKNIDKLKEEFPTISGGYKNIIGEQYELFASKHLSYGMDNISMGTQLKTPEEKKLALTAIWIRCSDKINRLKNLVLLNKENYVENEPVIDAWIDLCNYAIIAQLVMKDEWKK